MLCHAYALLAVSTNQAGTACRAVTASRSAARSCSSSQLSCTWLASRNVDSDVIGTKRFECGRSAQPFQAAGPLRADAADRDAQLRADLRVGVGGLGHQHGQQLL